MLVVCVSTAASIRGVFKVVHGWTRVGSCVTLGRLLFRSKNGIFKGGTYAIPLTPATIVLDTTYLSLEELPNSLIVELRVLFEVENHSEHHHDHGEDGPVKDDSDGDAV